MFNAYNYNFKYKLIKCQQEFSLVKFVVIVLILSLLINFVLINGRAFFMQAAAFPEPLATYPAFSAISSTVSGI